jgi:FAD-dependent urate hydroxylase
MPAGMFLRSSPDWHLDASGVDTFASYLEDAGIARVEVDPVPIGVFLDYAGWFQRRKHLSVRQDFVTLLTRRSDGFELRLDSGEAIVAEAVVASPGIGYFPQLPDWSTTVDERIAAHSCDYVRFDGVAGARVLVVGGRQSAYEWAALLGEAGAERIDIVHRHPEPRFERVDWGFVDPCLDETARNGGWWRGLGESEREAIARRFWEVGRLSLEWWLTPRLVGDRFRRWPETSVVGVGAGGAGAVSVELSTGDRLEVDRIVYATGYRAELGNVPYLSDVVPLLRSAEGFPLLDEAFQSDVEGLYFPGFLATQDFGPFFGFTKGCPVAAQLIVEHLLART